MKAYRHGDLLLVQVETIPSEAKKRDGIVNNILLEGEATGHMHRAIGAISIFDSPNESQESTNYLLGFLEVGDEGATLVHQEHKTLEIPKGNYKFMQQREYDPQENRKVQD